MVRAVDAASLCPRPLTRASAEFRHEDLERLHACARALGRAAGIAQSVEVMRDLVEAQRERTEGVEDALAALAVELAGHLVGQALVERPETFGLMVHRALTLAAGHGEVVVRAHPDDISALEVTLEALCSAAQGALTFVPDEAVARRSARIDTARGRIDCDLQIQLDALASNMGIERWEGVAISEPDPEVVPG